VDSISAAGGEGGGHGYVLGDSDDELDRLAQQAELYAGITEDVLKRAGIGPGMRVLDVGCGAGDVALQAARLVGPTGAVVGIDLSAKALETAAARAEDAGIGNFSARTADIMSLPPTPEFDAVTGRMILAHVPDPVGVLRHLAQFVRPGGVLAFLELDVSSTATVPELPLLQEHVGRIVSLYREVGVEPDMGSKLYATFQAAGLSPELTGNVRIEGGADARVYGYVAATVRTLLPSMVDHGIASAEDVDIDTLAERLRRLSVAGGHCILYPRMIGGWARRS
jgi:ubiquinone/menaquinone biosynthesis C-methylase UbiE